MATTTKLPLTLAALAAAMFAFSTPASAQTVTVDKPKIEITIQKTPRMTVNGPKEKRDTQKFWIEVEVEFQADTKGGDPKEEFVEALEFKYFITVAPKSGEKRKVYTLTVNHTNIPKGEKMYSVAYISPITVAKIMGKNAQPGKASVDVAVEIRSNGTLIAGDTTKRASGGSKWWNTMPNESGKVLPKSKTPFAWLWFDRYAQSAGE